MNHHGAISRNASKVTAPSTVAGNRCFFSLGFSDNLGGEYGTIPINWQNVGQMMILPRNMVL